MNIIKNENEKCHKEANFYEVFDSCGRVIFRYICASNIDAATLEAKKKNLKFWKVKRCFSGGVRG